MGKAFSRRKFGFLAGGAAAAMAMPYVSAHGHARRPRVVVVGGGAGGATAAKLLAGTGALDITLVEPKKTYVTCFFSNQYIAGLRTLESLSHGYGALAGRYGIALVHERAAGIDPVAKSVTLAGGATLEYDRLIVSPGIDFRAGAIEGYDAAAAGIMPHAWRAGPQSVLLRRQLEAMEDGGEFLIAPPAKPYRCTTAPYERASLAAHYFTGRKPNCRIVILDAKDDFPLQDQFEDGWNRFYPGMIEVLPGEFSGGVRAVKPGSMEVVSDDEIFHPAVANIIPPQTAGRIALDSGLADETGWCPVEAVGFESRLAPGVHVIGDAANAAPMPKAAYSARRQAGSCAAAVARALTGSTAGAPGLGGACWSYLTPDNAVRERAAFAVRDGVLARTELDISPVDEIDEIRNKAAGAGADWYRAITTGMFG